MITRPWKGSVAVWGTTRGHLGGGPGLAREEVSTVGSYGVPGVASLRKLPALMGFLGSEADQIPSMPTPFSDFEKIGPERGFDPLQSPEKPSRAGSLKLA